jgi:hypothetical protein
MINNCAEKVKKETPSVRYVGSHAKWTECKPISRKPSLAVETMKLEYFKAINRPRLRAIPRAKRSFDFRTLLP